MYIFQPDRYLLTKQVKKFSHYLKGKVLDVGAGGYSRYETLINFDEYIKMDLKTNSSIDVIGSAEDIPFGDNFFDSVICTQVFEHLKNPFKAAKEISRILKKNGCCLLTVPQTSELHEEPDDYFRYTNFGLNELFEKVGFEIIECDQRGGFFTLITQLRIRYLVDKFNLYEKFFWGKFAHIVFKFYARFMIFLDKIDKSKSNKKHTIGWCIVLKKLD